MKSESTPNPVSASIVDNLATAVVIVDASLRLVLLNPSAEMLFGVSSTHVQDLRLCDAIPHFADQHEHFLGAMATGIAVTAHDLSLRGLDERVLTVDYTATPGIVVSGGPGLVIEVTARDRPLRMSRDESLLSQHLASREVIRGLAHEIKNPLGGLRGAAQLLERAIDREDLREYTRVIIGEADRLRHLVDRLLGPDRPPRMEPLNIHRVLERVRQLLDAERAPGVVIERDYDPSIPDFTGDQDQLIQALLNVARNAAQAVGERGHIVLRTRARRKITIGHRCHRLVAAIEIIDDGPGVPADIIEHIFYPMVTSRSDGSGLGLSIAQYLVHGHGGIIECRSRPWQTVFTVMLPLTTGSSSMAVETE